MQLKHLVKYWWRRLVSATRSVRVVPRTELARRDTTVGNSSELCYPEVLGKELPRPVCLGRKPARNRRRRKQLSGRGSRINVRVDIDIS